MHVWGILELFGSREQIQPERLEIKCSVFHVSLSVFGKKTHNHMQKMDEQSRLTKDEETVQNNVDEQVPRKQSENVLLVAHELAKAGDELLQRFSKVKVKQDTLWDNVKRYVLIVTFRLLFGIV